MQYITAKQAAQNWNLTVRRVQDLCRNHQIDGTQRWGRDWMIPADAHRPGDRRRKKQATPPQAAAQLPRKNPAIVMSNLYHIPGSADQVAQQMETTRPEGAKLFQAQIAYCRGQIDTCVGLVEELLQGHCGHDLQIGCGLVLSFCAIIRGDATLWLRSKELIKTAPCHSDRDRYAVDFWLAAAECEIRETATFPLWFMKGHFDVLPGDSFPGARFYYLRLMHLLGHEYALGHRGTPDAQSRMLLFPSVAEPIIAQNRKEGAIISEIYTRLVCANSYHDTGNDIMAAFHLDKAIALALPDKLYMILAEYRRQMDFLMDERLNLADPNAAQQVRNMNKQFLSGWTVLHNNIRGRAVSNELTTREREVAKHAAFGLSNKEIAQRLHISVNTVKQSLRTAMDKTGALRRSDLFQYI